MRPGTVVGPLVVIAIGFMFLLRNLGIELPFDIHMFRDFWWMLIILIGLIQIGSGLAGRPGSLFGGMIVTTVGVLFGVQRLVGWHFGQTWPILLIVVGGIGLLRALAGPTVMFAGRRGWRR